MLIASYKWLLVRNNKNGTFIRILQRAFIKMRSIKWFVTLYLKNVVSIMHEYRNIKNNKLLHNSLKLFFAKESVKNGLLKINKRKNIFK